MSFLFVSYRCMTLGDAARDSGVAVWPASGDLAGQREARGTRGGGVRKRCATSRWRPGRVCNIFVFFPGDFGRFRTISDVFGRAVGLQKAWFLGHFP